jgi:hypothetical protein
MHRKLYHSTLRAEAADKYQDLCLSKARDLLANICQDKDSAMLEEHLHLYVFFLIFVIHVWRSLVLGTWPPSRWKSHMATR